MISAQSSDLSLQTSVLSAQSSVLSAQNSVLSAQTSVLGHLRPQSSDVSQEPRALGDWAGNDGYVLSPHIPSASEGQEETQAPGETLPGAARQ